MLIMTQDRVSGLASEKTPLSTYGPGNTRDESNRNSWVSSDGSDKLTVNCLGQVNGVFLGRYHADSVRLTYQGDEIFSNKTRSGFAAVGYANGSSGVITGTVSAIASIVGDYFYGTGTIVTITLNSASTYINVNDIITITGANASFNGYHRIVQVQQDTTFTRLNSSGNSLFFQEQGQSGSKIQVIVKDNLTAVNTYLTVGDTLSIENGAEIPLIVSGITSGSVCGLIVDENDVDFTYKVKFNHAQSSLLRSGDSPFTVNEYVSFEDCRIRTNVGFILSEEFDYSANSYESYYVTEADSDDSSFTIFVKPNTYFASNLVSVITVGVAPKVRFGSSFYYSGGGYQHKLGLSLITGSTFSTGSEEFANDEVLEMSAASISSISYDEEQITLNSINQTYLHKAYIKSRSDFSIKLPFKTTAFLFGANDTIQLRKYVVDTADAGTTDTGIGTPIRRVDVATRAQNTVADFVTGKLIRVESNYIPLPREAFPTRIVVELDATLNHNSANLFNEFLLEEVTMEHPVSEAELTTTDSSNYVNYKTDITSYLYNGSDDGILTLNMSANTNLAAGDYIYLYWPNNIPAQNNQITKSVYRINDTTIQSTTAIHELYEGMKYNGTNDQYILSFDTTTNQITLNTAHGITAVPPQSAVAVTFDHHVDLGEDAANSWTGFHRVLSSTSNGSVITLTVPNAGTKGDLTINANAQAKSATGAYVSKVKNGKGRFVRPIADGITKADAFLWNSGSTSVTYTYNATEHEINPGTAKLVFGSPHSLVNNDKILLYDLPSNTYGQYLKGLDSSYLVTYSSSNEVLINIDSAVQRAINGINAYETSTIGYYELYLFTAVNHGFSVGDKVTLNNMPTYTDGNGTPGLVANGQYVIAKTPTAKSFTVDVGGYGVASNHNPSVGSAEAITGVHYLTAPNGVYATNSTGSIITDLKSSRSLSIEDAETTFENPIEVGNLLYRDSLQYSSGQYDAVNDSTARFSKTPNIDDAASTSPYRPDSDTAIQNTFAGTSKSIISQINLIRGDATSEFDIHLVKPFGKLGEPYVFTKLLEGLKIAILRAGVSRTLPNPQVGVTNSLKDYSVRKELPTGAYYYLNRDSAKEFAGKISSDPESVDLLVDFGAEQLARPFPCLVISGNTGNMRKLRTRTALYGYFTTLPQATYNNKLVNLKEASFTIREVL